MAGGIEVRCVEERDFTDLLDRQVIALQRVAFPQEEHFKMKRWVHTLPLPHDRWFQAWAGHELAASVWLHHRTIHTPAGPCRVGGIANVCSDPAWRGEGAARACMRAAMDYMDASPDIDFGLLFCGAGVRRFYEALGWRDTTNRYLARIPGHDAAPIHENAIVLRYDAGPTPWPDGDIDLNGPEW